MMPKLETLTLSGSWIAIMTSRDNLKHREGGYANNNGEGVRPPTAVLELRFKFEEAQNLGINTVCKVRGRSSTAKVRPSLWRVQWCV